MNAIALQYKRIDGTVGIARVFTGDDGVVTSAYGLEDLLRSLAVRKHTESPGVFRAGASYAVQKFFDRTGPCTFDGCDDLRIQMDAELTAAETRGCTSCAKSAIMRKYQKLVMNKAAG